jgi:hypothetical protein
LGEQRLTLRQSFENRLKEFLRFRRVGPHVFQVARRLPTNGI